MFFILKFIFSMCEQVMLKLILDTGLEIEDLLTSTKHKSWCSGPIAIVSISTLNFENKDDLLIASSREENFEMSVDFGKVKTS